ncbi:MAG: N-acetylmuramoyl-L-alanine amidase [Myxococcota bacterium]|jgi:uncharacterized protein (TIGR03382 family)
MSKKLMPAVMFLAAFALTAQALAAVPEYEGATWLPAHTNGYAEGRRNVPIDLIIIQVTEGTYANSIAWFQAAASGVSTHYLIRASDGDVTQMVEEANTAYHAGNMTYNRRSIGIEHEGYIANPDSFTTTMYQASADLVIHLCEKYNIPKDREHIIGQNEVPDPNDPSQFGGIGHRQAPGQYWDWDYFMSLIRQDPPATTGELIGFVREGDIYDETAGIVGATVKLTGGPEQTTNENGRYHFTELTPGEYTITASAEGYSPVSIERTVKVGEQTWGSIALEKIGCVADCTGRECGSDGCTGSCGTCEQEGALCVDGTCVCQENNHLRCCDDNVCWVDSCGNLGQVSETCQHGCADGICINCQPQCDGKECGDDGCEGFCGVCDADKSCVEGQCVCIPEHHQDCCGERLCWYDSCGGQGEVITECDNGCHEGLCIEPGEQDATEEDVTEDTGTGGDTGPGTDNGPGTDTGPGDTEPGDQEDVINGDTTGQDNGTGGIDSTTPGGDTGIIFPGDGTEETDKKGSGGCQSGSGAFSAWALLALLGALLVVRRRQAN